MSLIYCPECAHQISDQTITCTNCGFPVAQRRQLQQPQPLPTPVVPRPLPQSNQNNQAVTIIGLGICALIFIALLVTCNSNKKNEQTKTTTKTVTPKTQTNNSGENPDTSNMIPIPMVLAGSAENGRYFLMAHRQANSIDEVDYIRTKNEAIEDQTVTYGRMQIQCGANKIRKYTSDSLADLETGDLDNWYTPTPNWTDRDIYNFICQNRKTVKKAQQVSPAAPTVDSDPAEQNDAIAVEEATPQDNETYQYQVTPSYEPQKADEPSQKVEDTPKPMPKPKADPEPVPVEVAPAPVIVSKPKYNQNLEPQKQSYTNQISSIIKSNWKLPMAPKFNTVRATFNIAPNGEVSNIKIHSDDVYAQSTLYKAIESSSPLPPVPNGLEDEFAYNSMTFRIR